MCRIFVFVFLLCTVRVSDFISRYNANLIWVFVDLTDTTTHVYIQLVNSRRQALNILCEQSFWSENKIIWIVLSWFPLIISETNAYGSSNQLKLWLDCPDISIQSFEMKTIFNVDWYKYNKIKRRKNSLDIMCSTFWSLTKQCSIHKVAVISEKMTYIYTRNGNGTIWILELSYYNSIHTVYQKCLC